MTATGKGSTRKSVKSGCPNLGDLDLDDEAVLRTQYSAKIPPYRQ